ncbi:SdrD B-like domain-containing protein [Gardnerella vaginalis]|uniref:SdrD B-like domain-containing protein n=1 Tax=Gardnerella vaginalis TaxID=2702 RepID=UPI0015E13B2C|nr:SdrD B-like domain-containing protein [Gardnerella vaginalis]MDK7260209.1 SdrD B-like domain-containing protein [Gardnerella vaginalis]MDK8777047.1 SdrD B-like domain-containing protein [Gardnerella vaginalis]
MKMKIVTASLLTATLLTASLSSSALAQPSNDNAFTNHENIPTNKSSINNIDLIPAPTQHFGKPDGKLPEVRTSISYVDGDSTDNHADTNKTNKTNKILRPGSKLTLRATAKFIVPEAGDVFRPYLRLAIPKILTVNANDFVVDAGNVANKVVQISYSKSFGNHNLGNYNLFDVYFNYNEWSSDFATEMPHLASIKGVNHSGNVLSNGDVIKNNQTVSIEIPTVVDSNANTSDLVDLKNYKKGVKPLIQGRVSYMPFPTPIEYTSTIGGLKDFPNDKILQDNPCLVRSDLVTGWDGRDDYGFWFTGLSMETSGVDYDGRSTMVESQNGVWLPQLIPANIEHNQFVTIYRNGNDNNPIKLRFKIPFGSKNYALNGTKQALKNHHLTVFRSPNNNAEARKIMGNIGIEKVAYENTEVFGDILDSKYFDGWGTVPEQSRPSELLISGEFNPDSTVFGPDNISNGIWMSGKASASIKSYYRALDCNDNYPDSTLKYPPIINKIQETVATYARSNRSKVSTVPIEIVIPASLSGRVWFDANHNGIQDKGESSIIGAKVQLVKQYGDSTVIDINGNEVKPITTTSPDGYYEFTNLLPGSYVVKFTLPEGSEYFGFTYTHKGSDSSVDSDAIPGEPVTDRSVIENGSAATDNSASKDSYVGNINLSAGEDKKHIDAGAFKKDDPKKDEPKDPKPNPDPKKDDPKDPDHKPKPKNPQPDPKNPKEPKPKDPKPKDPQPKPKTDPKNPKKDKPKDPDNKPKPNPEPKQDDPKDPKPKPKTDPKNDNPVKPDTPKSPDPKKDDPKKDEPEDPDPKDTNPKSENPKDNENPKNPESKPDDPKSDTPKDPDTDDTESNDPPQYEDPQPKEDSSGPNHSEIRESDNPIPSSNNDLDSNNSQSNESSFDNNNADFKQEHVRDKLVNTGVSTVFTAVASVAMLALGATNKIKRYLCRGKHRQ